MQGNFTEASLQYQLLAKQTFFTPPEVTLNLANSFFEVNDTISARRKYTELVSLKEPLLASTTYSQLGIILCTEKDTARALVLFKEALILKPDNDIARFNYELLKRLFHPQKSKVQSTPKNSENRLISDKKTSVEQQKVIAEENSQKELLKTLKNYGLTPEKAKMILDGMKNNEIQYIQHKNNLVKSKELHITKNW